MTKPVTIATATDTHFALNGRRMPRVFVVFPAGNADALIVSTVDGRERYSVPLASTVGGSVRSSQSALIEALADIVGGIGGASKPGEVNVEGDLNAEVDPQSVADAGSLAPTGSPAAGSQNSLLAEIRDAVSSEPPFTPVTGVLANGTAAVVDVEGIALPRTIFVTPDESTTVRVRARAHSAAAWRVIYEGTGAWTDALVTPEHEIEFQRTGGSGTTSAWGIA